uniref:Lectin protein n=1 Tax=Aquarana catesbeiana TaxID=8400 RepID=K4PWB9_AQUCT|nr:lectin precursor protein [Aquarana catesbeiana]
MFTLKKSLLLLFFLGTINLSLCEGRQRDVDQEERRDDPGERNVQVEKRFLTFPGMTFGKLLGK